MSNLKPRSVRPSAAHAPGVIKLGLDLSVASGIEACPISRARLRRVLLASLSSSKKPLRHGAMISLRLCDAKEAKTLNRVHRGKAYASNVLTFEYPSQPGQALVADIAICLSVVGQEAKQQGKTLESHFVHLLVHGCLHALGFDHLDERQAEVMESLERKILKRFRISDPYLLDSLGSRRD